METTPEQIPTTLEEFSNVNFYGNYLLILHRISLAIGYLGNVISCIVIMSDKSMRTVTSYYLFSLSIADLLLLSDALITNINSISDATLAVLKPMRAVAGETAVNASISIIAAFTAERYVAICHPLRAHAKSTVSRTIKILVFIWLICVLYAVTMEALNLCERMDYTSCDTYERVRDVLEYCQILIFALLAFIAIPTMYILIAMRISRRSTNFNGNSNTSCDPTRKNSLKIMGAIVVVLYICWTPYLTMGVIFKIDEEAFKNAYFSDDRSYSNFLGTLFSVCMLSPVSNPIIYSSMSAKFRSAFKELFWRCFKCQKIKITRGGKQMFHLKSVDEPKKYLHDDSTTVTFI